jgi:hypothetical protein
MSNALVCVLDNIWICITRNNVITNKTGFIICVKHSICTQYVENDRYIKKAYVYRVLAEKGNIYVAVRRKE